MRISAGWVWLVGSLEVFVEGLAGELGQRDAFGLGETLGTVAVGGRQPEGHLGRLPAALVAGQATSWRA